jgi:ADP-ribose pyrophosphatase YjhB (NUDIX family)
VTKGKRWNVGATGAVVHEGKVLLVRSTYGGGKDRWLLPGGYAAHVETLDQTAVRKVREETGIEAEVVDVIGLRTQYTEHGGVVFVLFRMRLLSGQPVPGGTEVDRAAYFSAAEVAAMGDDEVLALSRHAALAVLGGGRGLPENESFRLRDETYRAFLLEQAAEQIED